MASDMTFLSYRVS